MGLSGLTWLPQELYVLILALLVGLVAALPPAIQAYRTHVGPVPTALSRRAELTWAALDRLSVTRIRLRSFSHDPCFVV
jgi:hypothetical protein